MKFKEKIKLLYVISRPEFIPANSASLIIGLSWSIGKNLSFELLPLIILVYSIITTIAFIAAQFNTMYDYELDLKDKSKGKLVKAMKSFGQRKLKMVILIELLLSFILILILSFIQEKPALMILWIFAVFLAYAYSTPPLQLKSRSFLASISLPIVLSTLPIFFVFYSFTSEISYLFLYFLIGHALIVYGVIVPAEIRDYFRDKSMGIKTMTVKLGLVRASILSILLLSVGGIICGTSLFLSLLYGSYPIASISIIIMLIAFAHILRKYKNIYSLSVNYSKNKKNAQKIVEIATDNPKWITLITQVIVILCLVLLISNYF